MAREVEIRRLLVRLVGNLDGYKKMLSDATKLTVKKAGDIGKKVSAIGGSFSRRVTAPLLAFGAGSVAAFAGFDKAMIESTSIMKVNEAQMEAMRVKALQMSRSGEFTQGPKDLAESYFFLASAGKDAEQAMALLPTVSKFATAGAFDMALATDLLTDAQSALGLSSKEVAKDTAGLSRVANVLVKANTLANASVQQFSEALTNDAGAALRSLKKDVEEGVAVLAVFADQGIKGNVAGSMLGRAMRLLNTSAVKNAKAYKEAGVAVFDASGNMRNMADIVEDLENHLGGMSDEQRTVNLEMLGFAALAQKAITPLLGNSQAIRDYQEKLESAGGTIETVANKQMKSFSSQMGIMKNRITVVAIEIGQALVPLIMKMNTAIQSGIDWWMSLDKETKEWIVSVGVVVAAVGPLLIIIGQLIALLASSVGTIGTVVVGIKGLTGALIAAKIAAFAANAGLMAVGAGALYAVKLVVDLMLAIKSMNDELKKSAKLNNDLNQQHSKRLAGVIKNAKQTGGAEGREILGEELKRAEQQFKQLWKQTQTARNKMKEFSAGGTFSPFEFKIANQQLKETESRLSAAGHRLKQLRETEIPDFGIKNDIKVPEEVTQFKPGDLKKNVLEGVEDKLPKIEVNLDEIKNMKPEIGIMGLDRMESVVKQASEVVVPKPITKDPEKTRGESISVKNYNANLQSVELLKNLVAIAVAQSGETIVEVNLDSQEPVR